MSTFGPPPDDPQPAPAPAEPQQAAPSGAGTLSPDGRWVWDGAQWTPAPVPPQPAAYGPGQVPPPAGYPAPYPVMPYAMVPMVPCPSCGQPFGPGISCQVCSQVANFPLGIRLSPVGRRLGAHLLDSVLAVATLLIGWMIWSLIVWKDGQSPGKALLHMRVASRERRAPATWGTMFLREFVGKGLLMGVLWVVTIGIAPLVLAFMLLWDRQRQELWDKVAGTLVVDDPVAVVTPVA